MSDLNTPSNPDRSLGFSSTTRRATTTTSTDLQSKLAAKRIELNTALTKFHVSLISTSSSLQTSKSKRMTDDVTSSSLNLTPKPSPNRIADGITDEKTDGKMDEMIDETMNEKMDEKMDEKEVLSRAQTLTKNYIRQITKYNEIKDVAMTLLTLLAERGAGKYDDADTGGQNEGGGRLLKDVMEEFGVDEGD